MDFFFEDFKQSSSEIELSYEAENFRKLYSHRNKGKNLKKI